jgi:SAM-dependent methyltransferase
MRVDLHATRRLVRGLRRTPLHPQWLLGGNGIRGSWVQQQARGVVLDIGCADRWLEKWVPCAASYIGLDYPTTGKFLYGARPDIFADTGRLPFVDSCIDTVVILEVMEHIRLPREALHEIARVLRPQGRILLTMPFLYPIHDAPHDYQRLTIHGLMRDAQSAGLHIDELSPTLGSAETAGMIACLAMAGMALRAVQRRSPAIVFVPILLAMIPVVNLLAWLSGKLLPSWEAITAGYRLTGVKL